MRAICKLDLLSLRNFSLSQKDVIDKFNDIHIRTYNFMYCEAYVTENVMYVKKNK